MRTDAAPKRLFNRGHPQFEAYVRLHSGELRTGMRMDLVRVTLINFDEERHDLTEAYREIQRRKARRPR